jgi:hypothetical protein
MYNFLGKITDTPVMWACFVFPPIKSFLATRPLPNIDSLHLPPITKIWQLTVRFCHVANPRVFILFFN